MALVFCNTRKQVDELSLHLQGRGYFADNLHGGMNQRQRDRVMDKFKNGTVEVLVATDVAARGIDIDDIEMVFNYDVPRDEEYYVHRIGRTGRAGRKGKAFTFVSGKEIYQLKDIQKYTKTKIPRKQVPSPGDIEKVKMDLVLEDACEIVNEENLAKEVEIIEELTAEDYTSLDIAAALLKIVTAADNNNEEDSGNDFGDTGAEPGMVRLFINVGKNQNVSPGDVVGAIAGETGISGNLVGLIDIYDRYTFVEVPRDHAQEVLRVMKNNRIKGKNINIEPANPK